MAALGDFHILIHRPASVVGQHDQRTNSRDKSVVAKVIDRPPALPTSPTPLVMTNSHIIELYYQHLYAPKLSIATFFSGFRRTKH
jgi:hypothetical protein